MDITEPIEYFENKKLPKTAKLKGAIITNCESFVQTNIFRVKEGAPIIKSTSAWLLQQLHDVLEGE